MPLWNGALRWCNKRLLFLTHSESPPGSSTDTERQLLPLCVDQSSQGTAALSASVQNASQCETAAPWFLGVFNRVLEIQVNDEKRKKKNKNHANYSEGKQQGPNTGSKMHNGFVLFLRFNSQSRCFFFFFGENIIITWKFPHARCKQQLQL